MKPSEVSRLPVSCSAKVLLDGVVAAAAGAGDDGEAGGGWLGEEVDGSADGVGAVEGGA